MLLEYMTRLTTLPPVSKAPRAPSQDAVVIVSRSREKQWGSHGRHVGHDAGRR